MNRFFGFLVLLLGIALVTNCTNDTETKRAELTVTPNSITFDPNVAANNIVTVSSNTEWSVSPSHTDLKLDKNRGKDNGSIAVLSIPAGKSYTFTVKTITSNVFTNEVNTTVTVTRPASGGSGDSGGGSESGGDSGESGEEPDTTDPNIGKVVYKESFGTKSISSKTYADTYSSWSTTGSGAESVEYTSSGATVRNDDYGSAGKVGTYAGASGGVYVRLPYANNWLIVNDITLPSGSVNYSLTIGGGQSADDLDIYLGDGTKWVALDYENATDYNKWALGEAKFTLSEPRKTLSIRIVAPKEYQHGANFDDITLKVIEEGGQIINIAEGHSPGETGDDTVDVTKMSWAELPMMDDDDLQYVAHFAADAVGKNIRNFSMGFDKSKKAALWVAYPIHTCYTNGNAGRTEEWGYDPKIQANQQVNLEKSYKEDQSTGADYNRGHQLASADRQASKQMNAQTYYYSNMTPQQSAFNSGIWGTLEDKVRSKQCSDTLYVVTGVHFDPKVKMPEAVDADGADAPVPTHYYKVLIRTKSGNTGKAISECSASELMAIGFWMEHPKTNKSLDKSYKEYAVSVEDIEELTGHTFFPTAPAKVKQSFDISEWKF
ncbi:MAG: DNA/RNA non-specific endonuclease [Tidjanibacter sp.]|nr:DNA/RNA non-specific endonuclease [Tidjanibacter sp.]